MKVISSDKMAYLEKLAYQEGCSDWEFMEQAGAGIAKKIEEFFPNNQATIRIILLCGKGNNGGDAFVAGCHLLESGYTVSAVQLDLPEKCSPLCRLNGQRFQRANGIIIDQIPSSFNDFHVIIDGIFGTGFKGEMREPYASLVRSANRSEAPIFAVDIPSGLNGTTGEASEITIKASATCFLQMPKTGFFLKNGWDCIGELHYVSFGLPEKFVDQADADFELFDKSLAKSAMPQIQRSWHKYQRGLVVGLGGSPSMPGAALLSSLSALHAGSGIVKLLYPHGMEVQLSSSPYELIKIPYQVDDFSEPFKLMQKAGATFVGPGIGRTNETIQLLSSIIPQLEKPCVIDADALTLLSEKNFALPKEVILTPHTGEMCRLLPELAPFSYTMESLNLCQQYATDNHLTLVLKGPVTYIFHPNEPFYVNIESDPGMATAGSGDVLTGLITSLVSQGLTCHQAALLGVYLHGLAGKIAARSKTSYNITASDIIAHFPEAYRTLI